MSTILKILKRELILEGQSFGNTGAYEKLVGTIYFQVDPELEGNRCVTDILIAPRNPEGLVEFSADFYILKPVEMQHGNGKLLLDVPNRGRKVAIEMFNSTPRVPDPTTSADFGNGFLMREGYSVAWVGWQSDVLSQNGLMALDVPKVPNIKGYLRCRLRPNENCETLPLADRGHIPIECVDENDPESSVSYRQHVESTEIFIKRGDFYFPDSLHISIKGGFKAGYIYDVIYPSANPSLIGAGFLAVRDTVKFLRWGLAAEGNPCAGGLDGAYAFGVSQSGRFLREMMFHGFDQEESGRLIFDAIWPHVAGSRRGEFNIRFGQASLNSNSSVGSLPPFEDLELFKKIISRSNQPKIISTNSSSEYWRGDASLSHTDIKGLADSLPLNFSRKYLLAGTQHSPGSLPPPDFDVNTGGRGANVFNIVDYSPLMRAILDNLNQWVTNGILPPENSLPQIANGTAVNSYSLAEYFGKLPQIIFPTRLGSTRCLDFGGDVNVGVVQYPVKMGDYYKTYVSAINSDGNETVGLIPMEIAVPLATFTGWNIRHTSQGGDGDLMQMRGSTFAFSLTKIDREKRKDPRLSIEERYASKAEYLNLVFKFAQDSIAKRLILAEDILPITKRADLLWDFLCKK
jgi:hypothetical protein